MEQRYNSLSGRIALLLRLDKCRYLRSFLLPALGVLTLCAFAIWIGGAMLHSDSMEEFYSQPDVGNFFGWNLLWFVLTMGVIGAYVNRNVQHSGAVAFSSLPASLREKVVAMLISSLIIFGSFLLVHTFATLAIYCIRSNGFFSLELALDNVGDMLSNHLYELRLRRDESLPLMQDAGLWGGLCLYAFPISLMALLLRLAIAWPSYVKAVFATAVCALVGIILMVSVGAWMVWNRDDALFVSPTYLFLFLWSGLAVFHIRGMYKLLQRTDRERQ